MKRSKRYQSARGFLETGKTYALPDAIELVKKTATTKFDGSVEVHIRLGIDPKQSDQQVRGTVVLPHPTGSKKVLAAFVTPDKAQEAKDAGADFVYDVQDIEKIAKGTEKIRFDIALALPTMMRELGKIAKILGQKGLMPNPKTETVTPNIGQAIKELRGGKVAYRVDANGNIHQVVGRASFEPNILKENIEAFLDAVKRARPEALKGRFILGATIHATMGPGVALDIAS
ncbi:MAG: 50S ribosomal protein L1 [Candidatus Kerfeldbacteria bacterium]|nr:50S ribosomal protein L1 [Candidatus Kerfeldbacteria bacterium]